MISKSIGLDVKNGVIVRTPTFTSCGTMDNYVASLGLLFICEIRDLHCMIPIDPSGSEISVVIDCHNIFVSIDKPSLHIRSLYELRY